MRSATWRSGVRVKLFGKFVSVLRMYPYFMLIDLQLSPPREPEVECFVLGHVM
jgi:hypothetical protein